MRLYRLSYVEGNNDAPRLSDAFDDDRNVAMIVAAEEPPPERGSPSNEPPTWEFIIVATEPRGRQAIGPTSTVIYSQRAIGPGEWGIEVGPSDRDRQSNRARIVVTHYTDPKENQ